MHYLENARHEAFSNFDDEGGQLIRLTNCIFCPFELDDVCMAYQQSLNDKSKKPSWCRYKALIVGGDHE